MLCVLGTPSPWPGRTLYLNRKHNLRQYHLPPPPLHSSVGNTMIYDLLAPAPPPIPQHMDQEIIKYFKENSLVNIQNPFVNFQTWALNDYDMYGYVYILISVAGNVTHPEKLSYVCGAQHNVTCWDWTCQRGSCQATTVQGHQCHSLQPTPAANPRRLVPRQRSSCPRPAYIYTYILVLMHVGVYVISAPHNS